MPAAMAAAGLAKCSSLPPKRIVPPSGRSAAKTARAVSVRPGAEQARQPDDLAGMHLDRHVAHPPADLEMVGPQQLAADRVGVAVKAVAPSARTSARSRPSMAATSCSLVMSRHGATATVRPSRMIVTRSQTA